MLFKKYRIVSIGIPKFPRFRVDKRHWFFIIPYWDIGASDMSPDYYFSSILSAEHAIAKKVTKYKLKSE